MTYEEARNLPPIEADDPEALELLKERLEAYEEEHRRRMAINAYFKAHKTLEGCPELLPGELEHLDSVAEYAYRGRCVPFRKKAVDNMLGSIRAFKGRIKDLERWLTDPPPEGWSFEGGEVIINTEINQVQIFFDAFPDEDTIIGLRLCGFRFIPMRKAWERKCSTNAVKRAREFTEKT